MKHQYIGAATYTRTVTVPPSFAAAGQTTWLVIERIQRAAVISVVSHTLPTFWNARTRSESARSKHDACRQCTGRQAHRRAHRLPQPVRGGSHRAGAAVATDYNDRFGAMYFAFMAFSHDFHLRRECGTEITASPMLIVGSAGPGRPARAQHPRERHPAPGHRRAHGIIRPRMHTRH